MKTFRCEFLGCKVNQYDAERARRQLLQSGFQEAEENASVLLLASCTVTSTAARKGRQTVRAALRRHPGAHVLVMGCFTEEDRELYSSLPAPVTFLPSARDDDFLAALGPLLGPGPARPLSPASRRTRAFLKVEDGCDLSCSFCIIPSVRGRARSRAPEAVLAEAEEIIARGTREIVLTGVHLGHYGRHLDHDLAALVSRLVALPGEFRVRLSSLEVSELTPALVDLLVASPRLVPHLHLPLQSGSEAILRSMRRPYRADQFRATVRALRARIPELSLTTDVIVGFPGESEADFEATRQTCIEAAFSQIHIFPYSVRKGTHAATLPGAHSPKTIQCRKDELFQLEQVLITHSLESRLGHSACVLGEIVRADGSLTGYDERYHRVTIRPPHGAARGDFARGRIVAVEGRGLLAEACS